MQRLGTFYTKDPTNSRAKLVKFCVENDIKGFSTIRDEKEITFVFTKRNLKITDFESGESGKKITLDREIWKGYGTRGNTRSKTGPFYPSQKELWDFVKDWAKENKNEPLAGSISPAAKIEVS